MRTNKNPNEGNFQSTYVNFKNVESAHDAYFKGKKDNDIR